MWKPGISNKIILWVQGPIN